MNFETYWQRVTDGIDKRGLYTLAVVKELVREAFEIGHDFGGAPEPRTEFTAAVAAEVFSPSLRLKGAAEVFSPSLRLKGAAEVSSPSLRLKELTDTVAFLRRQLKEATADLEKANNELAVVRGANLRLEAAVKDMLEAVRKKRVNVEWFLGMTPAAGGRTFAVNVLQDLEEQLRNIANR